jgi:hypothetical protein
MKRTVSLLFISLLLLLLGPSLKAQWEDAQVQRLTHNHLQNKVKGLFVEEDDKLLLFYEQTGFDSLSWTYRDTLFLMTKEKGEGWSEPQRISDSCYEVGCGKVVGYEPYTGLAHLFYDCGDTLYYTNSSIPNWQTAKTDSGPDRVQLGDMAFDTLGNIHLIWNVDFDSMGFEWYRVMYANNSTGEWVKQQVSEPICLEHYGPSNPSHLAVQKNGTAHMVYHGEYPCDLGCVSFYVRNNSLNGINWMTDTVPKPPRPLWHYWSGPIEVGVSNKVHLLTTGCIDYDCTWPSMTRTFYYFRQAEDGIWQGEEQIPDSVLGKRLLADKGLFIDQDEIPYVNYRSSSAQVYFTDRKQGNWRAPYFLVGWANDPPPRDSVVAADFYFVLDSQGKGHGAFSGSYYPYGGNDDSLEIYYFSSSSSEVDSEEDNYKTLHFDLSQNYPNPFNSSTIITYEIMRPGKVGLKIYDLLGREVRELVNRYQKPSGYKVHWDGKNNQGREVASGTYFYLLRAGERKEGKKMLLIK